MTTEVEHFPGIREENLSSLLDALEDGVCILDSNYTIIAVNKPFAARLANVPEKLTRHNFLNIYPAFKDDIILKLNQGQSSSEYPLKVIDEHGAENIFLTTVIVIKTGNAAIEQVILIAKNQNKTDEFRDYVRQVDKLAMLGQLSAGIAHEIRNPLAGISTTAQVLKGRLDPAQREFIDVILGEINRLDSLVRELLDFARPSKPSKDLCNVHDVIERVLVLLQAQCVKARITVTRNYLEHNEAFIVGDAEQLMQAFLNIILNAIAVMSHGGELTIRTTKPDPHSFKILFQDTGCGINPAQLKDLFKPFFTTKTRGIGLGLTVTKTIIENHNGTIDVESVPGEGASFLITLPAGKGVTKR